MLGFFKKKEQEAPAESQEEARSWLTRMNDGLSKSADNFSSSLASIFTHKKLDDDALEALEELLIMSDMGASTAMEIVEDLRKQSFDKQISEAEVKAFLAGKVAEILAPVCVPLTLSDAKPHVVMMVGVNGNGKTTTAGKLALKWQNEGKKVMLAAGDTFRAAAVEQLQVWGERVGCEVVSAPIGADAASVAYQALERAKAEGVDVLLLDTAGRLQNKNNLMDELKKIVNVLKKLDADAPHTVLQVLDGTTGQNAISQVKTFKEMVAVNGLIVSKLDGTAKAGIVVALAKQFGLPLHAIGVGEGIEDLQAFEAEAFAQRLVGATE